MKGASPSRENRGRCSACADERSSALADYAHTVELGLGLCLRAADPNGSNVHTPSRRADFAPERAVVFGSDQRLVGRFNEVVVDHAMQHLGKMIAKAHVWAVGQRAPRARHWFAVVQTKDGQEATVWRLLPKGACMPIPNSAVYDDVAPNPAPAPAKLGLGLLVARDFELATGWRAVVDSLGRIEDMLAGKAGMQVCTAAADGGNTL